MKTGKEFVHFGLESGMVYEFEMDFKKSFCYGFYLSNDDIISVLRLI